MERKLTRGRQKIEMKRIQNEDDRLITFSKRRSGIYKKASELVTLCGAEIGIVVFSPAGKPFTFAHPSIESISSRFLGQSCQESDNTHPLVEAHRRLKIQELNQYHNDLLSLHDMEKEHEKMLKQMTSKTPGISGWWEAPIDELGLKELDEMNTSLDDLHKKLCTRINELTCGAPSSSLTLMNPGCVTSPFINNTAGTSAYSFPHGYDFGHDI